MSLLSKEKGRKYWGKNNGLLILWKNNINEKRELYNFLKKKEYLDKEPELNMKPNPFKGAIY